MKKVTNCILLFDLVMLTAAVILRLFNYQFLNWVKYPAILLGFAGIVMGTVVYLKWKKVLCIVLCVWELMMFGFFGIFAFFTYNREAVVMRDGVKMIKETHSVLLSNWENFYDYKGVIVRSRQPRITIEYDDCIGDYLYTLYYDDDGNITEWVE